MKLFSNKDLTWGALGVALLLMFIASNAFRGSLPEGDFSARVPMLLQFLGAFLASAMFAALVVVVIWLFRRFNNRTYETPRRDYALAVAFMLLVTFKRVDAAPLPVRAPTAAPAEVVAIAPARQALQADRVAPAIQVAGE